MELTIIKILAGLNAIQLGAMVLVVWLLSRRPAGIPAQPAKSPVMPVEKKAAFYQGVNGVMSGDMEVKR